MMKIDKRDWEILNFLRGGREARWTELVETGMMAKSTLSKHLARLDESKLIRKKISKTTNSPVYVITAKGKKVYVDVLMQGRNMYTIEDFM